MRRGVRLGVDVGTVRVGLAVSDPDGLIATAVETLPRDQTAAARNIPANDTADIDTADIDTGRPSDVVRIAQEVRDRGAIEVIVGFPLSMNGSAGSAAASVRGYAEALARVVAPVPVRLVDERLSTVSAHQALRSAGRPGRKQRSVVDQVAATVILQHALDSERGIGKPPGRVVR